MGMGGMVTGIMGLTNSGPKADVPNANSVGAQYLGLLSNYLQGVPKTYASEAMYQPKYTQLGLNRIGQVAGAMPGLTRAASPQAAGLLDTLSSQANTQLAQNGLLDPAMMRNLQQNVRGAQATRGLGYGPGDAQMEASYITNSQEQRRAANQQFASGVAGQLGQFYGNPFQMTPTISAGPQITPANAQYDMFNTAYNANAAKGIADANMQAAMLSGFNSMD